MVIKKQAEKTAKAVSVKKSPAPEAVQEAITQRARQLYQNRGVAVSTPEEQLNDWHQAEREVKAKYGLN